MSFKRCPFQSRIMIGLTLKHGWSALSGVAHWGGASVSRGLACWDSPLSFVVHPGGRPCVVHPFWRYRQISIPDNVIYGPVRSWIDV